MQSTSLLSRGRAALILFFCFILTACSGAVTPIPTIFIPTSTSAPTRTAFPTVTPIPPRSIPETGRVPTLPGLPSGATWTPAVPAGNVTPTAADPNSPIYDPLSPTLTVQAGLPTPTFQPLDTLNQGPTPEPIPTGKLLTTYLGLIPTRQGLWAMRPDGRDMTLLTSDPIFALDVSPGGTMVAYVTHGNPGTFYEQPYGYTLKVLTLRNDEFYDVARLDPPGLAPDSPPEVLDSAAQSLAAYQYGALSWSPDGRRLAFTSSHEAAPGQPANSDVYIFTPSAGRIDRLSTFTLPSGPAHGYGLRWSPEGQRLYYAAAYSFGGPGGSASGIWMAGSWISWLTGSLVQVSDGTQPGPDRLITWPSWSEVMLETTNPVCGSSNLRVVNVRTGATTSLWPGCYADIIYEKGRGQVIVSVTPDVADPEAGNVPGVYSVPLYRTQTQAITTSGFKDLYDGDFRAAWYGFNPGEGLFSIQRNGTVAPVFSGPPYDGSEGIPLRPLNRMRSGEWLWASEGGGLFRASPGQPPQPVTNLLPKNLSESPTVPGLFFFFNDEETGPVLYGVRSRDWQPFVVENRIVEPAGIIWLP